MRSTVSLRFVAVVSLTSLALAGQHANAGSGSKGRSAMHGSNSHSSRAAKSFTANRPSVQRSFGQTGFQTGTAKFGSHGIGSSTVNKVSGNPLTIKNPNAFGVTVAARAGGKGEDCYVPPLAKETMVLPNGRAPCWCGSDPPRSRHLPSRLRSNRRPSRSRRRRALV